jgi:hypothetical protein
MAEEEEVGCVVERRRRRRRLARAASTAVEETGRVESDGDIESFAMKSEMSRDGLLFIRSKLSVVVLNYNRF